MKSDGDNLLILKEVLVFMDFQIPLSRPKFNVLQRWRMGGGGEDKQAEPIYSNFSPWG